MLTLIVFPHRNVSIFLSFLYSTGCIIKINENENFSNLFFLLFPPPLYSILLWLISHVVEVEEISAYSIDIFNWTSPREQQRNIPRMNLLYLSPTRLSLSLSLCRAAKLCWIKVQELIIVVLEDIQSGEKMAIWLKFQSLIQNWRPLKSFYRLPLSLCLLNGTTRPNFPSSFSPTIVRWLRKQFYLEIW